MNVGDLDRALTGVRSRQGPFAPFPCGPISATASALFCGGVGET